MNNEEGGRVIRVCGNAASMKQLFALHSNIARITLGCLRPGGMLLGFGIYSRLDSDFLPPFDEGGFVIDYFAPYGTSLTETNRQLDAGRGYSSQCTPEVESYSRRTGARLALVDCRAEHRGFSRKNLSTTVNELPRKLSAELSDDKFQAAVPAIEWEFPGILSDLDW